MSLKENNSEIKILVIDDEIDWLEKITKYLRDEGFLITQANNYTSAKLAIQNDKQEQLGFTVVVLDLQLPDGNGMGLLDFVAPDWEKYKTKVVISTATGWTAEHEAAKAYPYYSDIVMKNNPDFKKNIIAAVHQAIKESLEAKL